MASSKTRFVRTAGLSPSAPINGVTGDLILLASLEGELSERLRSRRTCSGDRNDEEADSGFENRALSGPVVFCCFKRHRLRCRSVRFASSSILNAVDSGFERSFSLPSLLPLALRIKPRNFFESVDDPARCCWTVGTLELKLTLLSHAVDVTGCPPPRWRAADALRGRC